MCAASGTCSGTYACSDVSANPVNLIGTAPSLGVRVAVFVSVASYGDALLPFTLSQAYEKSAWPDEVVFGVVDQGLTSAQDSLPARIPRSQVRYLFVSAAQARGVCWARSLVMSMLGDEDWFLQIDSHTLFDQDWDAKLIDQANSLMSVEPNCVLTSYPAGFRFSDDGQPVTLAESDVLRAHVVAPGAVFEGDDPVLRFQARALKGLGAVEGFHIAAGALFASADFVQRFPWDPYLYFSEEEPSMALRLFTSGWTIFHPKHMPLFHLYNDASVPQTKRVLPWSESTAAAVEEEPLWSPADQASPCPP
jgi:hypothetical protein